VCRRRTAAKHGKARAPASASVNLSEHFEGFRVKKNEGRVFRAGAELPFARRRNRIAPAEKFSLGRRITGG